MLEKEVTIYIGGVHATDQPEVVKTLLGSYVQLAAGSKVPASFMSTTLRAKVCAGAVGLLYPLDLGMGHVDPGAPVSTTIVAGTQSGDSGEGQRRRPDQLEPKVPGDAAGSSRRSVES
jgi:hypothetical protein